MKKLLLLLLVGSISGSLGASPFSLKSSSFLSLTTDQMVELEQDMPAYIVDNLKRNVVKRIKDAIQTHKNNIDASYTIKNKTWENILTTVEISHSILPGLQRRNIGFSVQDIVDMNMMPAIENNGLNLSNMRINNLDGLQCIPDIENLDRIDLSHNQFKTIPTHTFNALTKITTIDLSYNQLEIIPSRALSSLTTLKTLNFDFNQTTSIDTQAFNGLRNLKRLFLSNNNLTSIPTDAFTPLANLVILNLEKNQFTTMPPNAFAPLGRLKNLNLANNTITTIDTQTFDGLKNLEKLNFSKNILTSIPTDSFTPLESLTVLNLDHNKVEVIDAQAFKTLKILTDLHLNTNKITKIHTQAFVGLTSLTNLHLCNNILDFSISNRFKSFATDLFGDTAQTEKFATSKKDIKEQVPENCRISF